jgi:hypothetical protein
MVGGGALIALFAFEKLVNLFVPGSGASASPATAITASVE